jgi:hypothetical protein
MIETKRGKENIGFKIHCWEKHFCIVDPAAADKTRKKK